MNSKNHTRSKDKRFSLLSVTLVIALILGLSIPSPDVFAIDDISEDVNPKFISVDATKATASPSLSPVASATPTGTPKPTVAPEYENIKLAKTQTSVYTVYSNLASVSVALKNCPEDITGSTFSYTSSNAKVTVKCKLNTSTKKVKITSVGKGTTTITMNLNGKILTLKHTHTKVGISNRAKNLVVGKTLDLSLKGYTPATWYTSDKKIATVTKAGKVTAKKTGNVIIYSEVEGYRIGCAISVVTATMKKVINKAVKIGDTCTYSQPKRMQEKYYDCSSLVWKSYKLMKLYFGDKSYAPTAAAEAKWISDKHGLMGQITNKKISAMKYNSGDVVFLTGANNGRYKGIYHVEMFIGYRVVGYDGETPILATRWANRPDDRYGESISNTMGRPI